MITASGCDNPSKPVSDLRRAKMSESRGRRYHAPVLACRLLILRGLLPALASATRPTGPEFVRKPRPTVVDVVENIEWGAQAWPFRPVGMPLSVPHSRARGARADLPPETSG